MNSILGQDVPLRVWPEKLAPGALFLESVRGSEALSELFQYELHLLGLLPAINYFEALLGQAIRIELNFPNGGRRTIHGLVGRLSQLPLVDPSANQVYGRFRALVVPRFWLSTKNQRNRVFQRQSVRQILGEVLKGLDVEYALTQSYPTRNFCVQYQESDFHFASRLMEEEGISYFFRHRDDGHQLVLSDDTSLADDLPAPNPIRFDATQGGERDQPRVSFWSKSQELMPQTLRFRDSHFELPLRNHLEASQDIVDTVQVGQVKHLLRTSARPNLEIDHFPGYYAKHYDNIDPQGAPADKQETDQVFEENKRLARLGMERIARLGLHIDGGSDAVHLRPGLAFELTEHADAAGKYLLTRVDLEARQPPPHSTGQAPSSYRNQFSCVPLTLKYRPALATPRPRIHGTQTALVVGMDQAEDVYCDKFARVKVQFHWDRQGQYQGHTSCWIRVAQAWAGKQFGALFIPRVGQEVLVAFLEGDPDQPVIVGSLYNAEHLPPVDLPHFRTSSGVKSHTVGGSGAAFNGLFLDDAKDQELVFLQSKKDLVTYSAGDTMTMAGGSYTLWVNGHYYERIGGLPIPNLGSGSGAGDGKGETKYVDKPLNNWFTDSWDNVAGYPEKPKDQPSVTWGGLTRPVLKMTMGISASNAIGLSFGTNFGGGVKLDVNPFAFLGAQWDVEKKALKVLNKAFMVAGAVGLFGNSVGISLGYSSKISVGPGFSYSRGTTYKIDGDYPDDPQFQTGLTDEARDAAAGIVSGLVVGGMLAADLMAVKATSDDKILAGLITIEVFVGVALATYLAFEMAPAIHRHHTRFKPYKKALKKAARKISAAGFQAVADVDTTVDDIEESAKAVFESAGDPDKVKQAFKSKTSSLNFARDHYVVIAQNILLYSTSPADQTKNANIIINAEGNPDAVAGQENGGLLLRASDYAVLLGGPGGVYIGNNDTKGDITIDGDADGKVTVKSKAKNKLTIDEKAVELESKGDDGITVKADKKIAVTGQDDLVIKAKTITLEGTEKITLKMSGETIVIDSNGITLNGKFFELTARSATIKSQAVEYKQ